MQEDHHQPAAIVQGLQINNVEAQHNADPSTASTHTLLNYMGTSPSVMETSMQQVPTSPTYLAVVPAQLQGRRCYVDASTAPDQPNQQPTTAGLGIFLLNMQEQPSKALSIRDKFLGSTLVIMAEAASLALASIITNRLNITEVSFLSDNEQLAQFLNKQDQSNPPDWRIKPLTQLYTNNATATASRTYKIPRRLNTIADSLTRQAFQEAMHNVQSLEFSCSNATHGFQCLFLQALHNVGFNDVTILAASCC